MTHQASSEAAAKTMSEVIRAAVFAHRHVHTHRGGAEGCSCGQRDPNVRGHAGWQMGHLAKVSSDALVAAGFGLMPDREDEK